jgi:nicotinate-nucleotide--dimethylbenzimidazole phosphoribosyltransferase
MSLLENILSDIRPVDGSWIAAARTRQLELTKPPGSLGRLEAIANRCAAIRESFASLTNRARIVLFAADHGVCTEGVSAYPQAVTGQMVLNFLNEGAAINAFSRIGNIDLRVVDIGVASALPVTAGLISRRVATGTRNFCEEPAMTEEEMTAALEVVIELALETAESGYDLVGFGEMGIGNTTAASAITAALTKLPVEQVVGRGTGVDDVCMTRKRLAVLRALAHHASCLNTPLRILMAIGGLEIAGMCGFCFGAAARRVPMVMDGFISTAAAALAVSLCPAVSDYLFASHLSSECGHRPLLALIGQEPLFDFQMRLGEGTGAALAMTVIRSAVEALAGMATFASAGVANK